MDKLLRIAGVLDKSGHYELSDKLFSIAQMNTILPTPIDVMKKHNPLLGYALSGQAPKMNAVNMTKIVNPLLGAAVTPEGLAAEKKVLDKVQANPVYQAAGKVQEFADQIKSPVSNVKTITAIGDLTGWFTKNIPSMIKTLEAAEQTIDVFGKNPVAQKLFQTLDVINLLSESVTFLTNIHKQGFKKLYANDAAGVTKYLAKIVGTFTNPNLTKYFPPLIPLQPQLMALNTLSSGMGLMVGATESLGTTMANMENAGSNRIEQIPQAQQYTAQGMKAKGATMPLDQLADKYGEVYNVLLDYVNKRVTIPQMIEKLGNEPGRMALMSAHIAQGILPPANGQYQISSYKKARDQARKQNQQNYVYSPGSGGMGYSR